MTGILSIADGGGNAALVASIRHRLASGIPLRASDITALCDALEHTVNRQSVNGISQHRRDYMRHYMRNYRQHGPKSQWPADPVLSSAD